MLKDEVSNSLEDDATDHQLSEDPEKFEQPLPHLNVDRRIAHSTSHAKTLEVIGIHQEHIL